MCDYAASSCQLYDDNFSKLLHVWCHLATPSMRNLVNCPERRPNHSWSRCRLPGYQDLALAWQSFRWRHKLPDGLEIMTWCCAVYLVVSRALSTYRTFEHCCCKSINSSLRSFCGCWSCRGSHDHGPNMWCFIILTWNCASRHNGAHFFIVSTSKSAPGMVCFVHFDFEMCYFVNHLLYYSSGWWFQTFLFSIYLYIWDNLSRWLIFFQRGWNHQPGSIHHDFTIRWVKIRLAPLQDDEATPHPNAAGIPRGWRGGRFGRLQWGNDNDDGYCQRIFFSDGYDKVMLVKYFDMTVIFSMIILMVPSLAIFKYELIRTLVWSHCCNDGRPLGFNNDWVFFRIFNPVNGIYRLNL